MNRSRLLVLYTGGTIGMRPHPSGLVPGGDLISELESSVVREPSLLRCDVTFDLHEPLIDSAEAAPGHWCSVAQKLWSKRNSFDASVVLHGTDTLAYTASALSFLLAGLGKAVVLTGSQVPYSLPQSDAPSNLSGAVACALRPEIAEVCIFFDGVLLRGNRTQKSSTRVGQSFVSPHWPPLARVQVSLELNEAALLPRAANPSPPVRLGEASIGLLKFYPGMSGRVISAAVGAHPDGLVIELYGSGTGPTMDEGLVGALKSAALRKTPLVGVSQCPFGSVGEPSYVSSRLFHELGVINGHDLTPEAALTKLHYVCALQRPGDVAAQMAQPVAGELTPVEFN
jgi:L-asparaginase